MGLIRPWRGILLGSVAFVCSQMAELHRGLGDKTVKVWDLESGAHQTLEGHTAWVSVSCVLPDGRIASGLWTIL